MRFDFHSHTLLSDGAMHPMDLVQRAKAAGHRALAITDHIGLDDAPTLLPQLTRACAAASDALDILVIPGVEITCVPPAKIGFVAKVARKHGAVIVVVHGETLDGATPKGTNAAAVRSAGVDILAHPGLIAQKDARAAAENGVFLEISGKAGHSLSNGHVARAARALEATWASLGAR
jgi:histidinol phosphatase-like PHP family hydrolase